MLPGSLYVLPFRLYCQPAYPALMELLKSRYEQNLGGPAFVRACVPIRWEHDDKNLSNACRSCHSMHNNLRLKEKHFETGEKGAEWMFWWWICIRCLDSSFWQTWLINIAPHSVSNKETNQGLVCTVLSYLLADKVFVCVCVSCFQVNKCLVKAQSIDCKWYLVPCDDQVEWNVFFNFLSPLNKCIEKSICPFQIILFKG